MLLLGFVLLVVLSVPLFRGRLGELANVRFRRLWVLALAAGLQAGSAALEGFPVLQPALHTASYVVAGGFFWANRRVPGLWLIGLGGAMNLAAIAANSGVMPADPGALAAAGLNRTRATSRTRPSSPTPTCGSWATSLRFPSQFRSATSSARGISPSLSGSWWPCTGSAARA